MAAIAAEAFERVSFDLPDGTMAGLRFGGRSEDELVFLHANGFNAHSYRFLLAPLGQDIGVLALDLRGHGRSRLPAHTFGYASWNRHRDDVIALITRHIRRPVVLAGHSLGATTALLVAGARPDLVRSLCLIEPVIFAPSYYRMALLPGFPLLARQIPLAKAALRRRETFPSRGAAADALRGRGIFAGFTEEMLLDHLADGLEEEGDHLRLACRPRFEAASFAAQRHDPHSAWKRAPSLIMLRAEKGSTTPPSVAKRLAELRPDARIATVEGAGHMLPMDRPARARAAIETSFVLSGLRDRKNLE